MSYCLNPSCSHPENSDCVKSCQSCGSLLTRLRDRYRVLQALAQGGFGATFLAKDEALPGDPICVIKQLRSPANAEVLPMAREMFAREAQTLGRIGNHPQVPRLLDYFEENGQFYLVQEYINGLTLQQEIKRKGPMNEAGVKQFLSDILEILQYIHERQVIHRDIKPNNLIRRAEDGRLVLIDFGAVKNQVNQTFSNQPEQTTLTAYAIGTAGFAPPEQIAMRPVYASDIYAVGVTCIYLLTGKSPKEINYNPTTGEMLWEREVFVSQHMTGVLRKMLEPSVRYRYQSASEVLNALYLEQNFDSLAQSMAAQSGVRKTSRPSQAQVDSHARQSVAGVAEAIRARRSKSVETVNANSTLTRPQVVTSKVAATVGATKTSDTHGKKIKLSGRLDTDSFHAAYANGRRDFALKDLSWLNMQRKDLSGMNFHSSRLDSANFQGANLCNSDFGQASLSQANLRDANLSKAYLSHADLAGADLRGADLSYAYLNHANLRGANLCGANLLGARLSDDQLAMAKTNWLTVRPTGKRG